MKQKWRKIRLELWCLYKLIQVRDDPKLPGDNGEVPISKWSDWWFNSHGEIFSLLDDD